MSICELRGYYEYHYGRRQLKSSIERRISSFFTNKCGAKFCLKRPYGEVEFKDITVTASPDLALYSPGDTLKAVLRVRVRPDLRSRSYDFVRLIVEGYVLTHTEKSDSQVVLALVTGKDQKSIVRALNYLADSWNLRPLRNDEFAVAIKVYSEDEAIALISRAVDVVKGLAKPRGRRSRACSHCEYRDICPAYSGSGPGTA